jgi:hypothetical protein
LMPTSVALAWTELQVEEQYQRSKAYLKQLNLIK